MQAACVSRSVVSRRHYLRKTLTTARDRCIVGSNATTNSEPLAAVAWVARAQALTTHATRRGDAVLHLGLFVSASVSVADDPFTESGRNGLAAALTLKCGELFANIRIAFESDG